MLHSLTMKYDINTLLSLPFYQTIIMINLFTELYELHVNSRGLFVVIISMMRFFMNVTSIRCLMYVPEHALMSNYP